VKLEVVTKVGVLAVDNGEYDQYLEYFDDPKRLANAVERLKKERQPEDGYGPEVSAIAIEVHRIAEVDDDLLDLLADIVNELDFDSPYESKLERDARLEQERQDRIADGEEIEDRIPIAPGQTTAFELSPEDMTQ
jgi:hypothetical protein